MSRPLFVFLVGVTSFVLAASSACTGDDPAGLGETPDAAAPPNPTGPADATTGGGDGAVVCADGLADCNGDGVCETSLASDEKNCGRCGRDCGGGACEKRACKPVTMITKLASPVAVAVNATALVVLGGTEGPLVCPKEENCGGTSPRKLLNTTDEFVPQGPHTLLVDEKYAYWLGKTGAPGVQFELRRCEIAGCAFSPTPLDESQLGSELHADGVQGLRYDPTGGVTRVWLDQSNAKEYLTQATVSQSYEFAVSSGALAFSNRDSATGPNRGVWTGRFANERPTKVMNEGLHVALFGGVVYASRSVDATYDAVFSCAAAGCGSVGTNLGKTGATAGTGKIAQMIADASGLYWLETLGSVGRVMRCALPDCPEGPQALAVVQAKPIAMRTDDRFVYWVNAEVTSNDGTVQRVAKP